MSLTFDKLNYVDSLKAAGVEEKVSRAHANALDVALHESVATQQALSDVETALKQEISEVHTKLKQEISEVRTELKQDILEIRKDMEAMENRLLIKLGGMMIVGISVLAVLMKIL